MDIEFVDPNYTVIESCEQDAEGVHYRVVVAGKTCWYRYVRFGQTRQNRAGGPAFVDAAREQSAQAACYRT